MDDFRMDLSLFWCICLFLVFFCHSSGSNAVDAEDKTFHNTPDHNKLQRFRRQNGNETLTQNETASSSSSSKNETSTTASMKSTTLLSTVVTTGKTALIVQDNTTVATSRPTTSHLAPVKNSTAYMKSENNTQNATVDTISTSIASTQHSTVAMSNSTTQETSADTKATTSTSTLSAASVKFTDPTLEQNVTSVVNLVTGVKHATGQSPTTAQSMTIQTTSTLGQDIKGETDFGRYGLLAFGITIAMVLILIFALIFVLTRQRKKSGQVDIHDEDRSPRLRMLEVPGLGESKDDGLQTYSLGYDNGNNRISVRPTGGIQTPFVGVSTFMLSKRGSNSSTNGSSSSYVSPRNSAMSPLKESPYEFKPLVSDTPSRKGSQRSNASRSMKISDKEDVGSEI